MEIERVWRPGEDYVMTAAFIGLVDYLVDQDWALANFTADTGIHPPRQPKNGLEAMIDEATGYDRDAADRAFALRFMEWVAETQWGEPMPPTVRDAFNAAREAASIGEK